MTPDELKSIPKGSFVVMKTGTHPMRTKLRLFLDWGIRFGEPYTVEEKAHRKVVYADKQTEEIAVVAGGKAIEVEGFLTHDEMSEQAFNDQCTGANPRYPLIAELKEIYLKAYYGK